MNIEDFKTNTAKAATLLKLLGNEKRLFILCQLGRGEKSVGELVELVNLSQSALSQHLAKLRQDQLVSTRRVSQTIYYSLSSPEAERIIETLYSLYCPEDN